MTSNELRKAAVELRQAAASIETILALPRLHAAARDHAIAARDRANAALARIDRGRPASALVALTRDTGGTVALETAIVFSMLGLSFFIGGTILAEPLTGFVENLPIMITDAHSALADLCESMAASGYESEACS